MQSNSNQPMKRVLKWTGIILLIPIVLLFIVMTLLYLPPVQDYAVRTLTAYASEETGMDIRLDRVRLRFLLDLSLQGLVVRDAEGDTLVDARSAVVDLDFKHIWQLRVGVESIALDEVQLNTKDMIAAASISGGLHHISLSDDINLSSSKVQIADISAQGLQLDIALRDTTVIDTTESAPLEWVIALQQASIEDATIHFTMPDDSAMSAKAVVGKMTIGDALLDLGAQRYTVAEAALQAERAALWLSGNEEETPLALDSVYFVATDIAFDGEQGHLSLPSMALQLPESKLTASADMDFNALEAGKGGGLDLSVSTSVAKKVLLQAGGAFLPEGFAEAYPDLPLHITLSATGNMDHLTLTRAEAILPGSIYADAQGDVSHVMDSLGMRGNLAFNVKTENINWIRKMADGALDGILLPPMQMDGTAAIDGDIYDLQAMLHERDGSVSLHGKVNMQGDLAYDAKMQIRRFQIRHFMPSLAMGPLTASATAHGSGTDFFSRATRLEAQAKMQQLTYDIYDLSNTSFDAQLKNGKAHAQMLTESPILTAQADVDAMLSKEPKTRHPFCELTFGLDLSQADLHALGVADQPLKASMCLHLDGFTNLDNHHQLSGAVNDIILLSNDSLFHPAGITMDMLLDTEKTHATLRSGDLSFQVRGHTGYDKLLTQLDFFMAELNRQMSVRQIDEEALTKRLPQIDVQFHAGNKNFLHDMTESMDYGFENILFNINLDPLVGINGKGHIYKLNTGAILLDTLQTNVYQDSTSIRMDARIHNGRRNPQFSFDSKLNASLDKDGIARMNLIYLDERGRKGVDLGFQGSIANDTLAIHLDPLNPVIAYRKFHLNPKNFIMLTKNNHIDADVDLLADDGTGLKFYSSPNEEALQDLSLSINRLNLGELSSVVPYIPRLGGFLHGDAHFIQTEEALSVSTDMNIDGFRYEDALLGQIGLQAVYLPNADGSHFVDGSLLHTGMPVATFSGTYTPDEADGLIDVNATLDRFPFTMANGFFPDNIARLDGVTIGDIHVGGSTSKPLVNGDIATVGLRILSDPYSLKLTVADDTIRIRDSQLNLNQFKIYSTGKEPFTMDGSINFANLDRIYMNTTMNAKNFELINAKKTPKSIAYGKVFVDFFASMKGTLDNLRVAGRLNVLGNTDVTYLLTDSPLTVEDQLAGLVEFVDFGDSLRVETPEAQQPLNINVDMRIGIENATQVHCLLSADGSSYVDIQGGGDLGMTYSPEKDMQLMGRYTINSGTLKYTMMVIPLKEFTIKNGSYAEFSGPLMNPKLNITATEQMRTTITENEQPRSVNFEVGMKISQTLENLGLEFTLDAPDDMNIQNELSTMSVEQRGRLAVTMLATGMYINDAGATTGGGVTGQNALNAFLQSQVSNITSKALKSVDLSMGVEQGTSATGTTTTDYSFRFAKRFWGNRISVIVGGKVSTGENAVNTGESIIDNVSIEYRLDQSATRYVNVFYDKNYESLLDGEITEMGAGLVMRRKTERLGELFLFKNKKKKPEDGVIK